MSSATDSCSPHSDLAPMISNSCISELTILSALISRRSLKLFISSKSASKASPHWSLRVPFCSSQERTVPTCRCFNDFLKSCDASSMRPSYASVCCSRTRPISSSSAAGWRNSLLRIRAMTCSTVCLCRFVFQSSRPVCHRFLLTFERSSVCTVSLPWSVFRAFWFSRSTALRCSVFVSTTRSISPGTAWAAAVSFSARVFSSPSLVSLRPVSMASSSEEKSSMVALRAWVASSRARRMPRISSSVLSPRSSVFPSRGRSSSSTRFSASPTSCCIRLAASEEPS
mmetsp:Transcript_37659/g.111760  ORF Transcript_37659/g.111760 Transcript_37659/m.111760 type:complete len:284 (+) Transcript_37659:3153-4004(+)